MTRICRFPRLPRIWVSHDRAFTNAYAEEYLTQLEETLGFAQKYRNVCDLCDKLTALTDENVGSADEKEKMKSIIEDIKNAI